MITSAAGQRLAAMSSGQKSPASGQAARFQVIHEPEPLSGRAQPNADELISFHVDYCLLNAELKENGRLVELCRRHGLDPHDGDAMKARLQQVLFLEKRSSQYLANPLNHQQYKQAFDDAAAKLSDAQCRAIDKWTDVGNSYTADLNEALSEFAKTGVLRTIPDPEDVDGNRTLNIHEEVVKLNEALALIPHCETITLRIAHVTEPEHCKAHTERIGPGMLVSNYPRFMSASTRVIENDDLMDAFDGKPGEVVLISELHGLSGKPLGEFNPANDIEEEVLFGPQSVFVLAGTARAVPDSERYSTRVAAIYIEVKNYDPLQVPNLHTGELPSFSPRSQT